MQTLGRKNSTRCGIRIISFNFSWDSCNTQETLKTTLRQTGGGGAGVNKLIMGNAKVENWEQSLQLVSNKHTAILLSSGGCSKTCWTSTISSDGRGGRGGGAVASVGRGGRGGGTSWTGAVSVQWKKSDNKYKTQNRRQNKGSCLMLGINHCPVW